MHTKTSSSGLFSKRPELHAPGLWPESYERARGITITANGRKYLDFSGASVGACVLGYGDEDVDQAVIKAIARGSTSAIRCAEDEELAEQLTLLHPWAEKCRFARSGGEAIMIAMRIAQAATGRRIVLSNGSYHGWHVNDPTRNNHPVHPAVRKIPNHNIEAFRGHTDVAAILIEPSRLEDPEPGYLEGVRNVATEIGAALIFDEISAGFRRNLGGCHLLYNVDPDIAVFSKAVANGYPMAAVIGREDIMSGGDKAFISSTTWSERIGPTAAIATIGKMWALDVFDHTKHMGELVRGAIDWHSKRTNLGVRTRGFGQMLHVEFPSAEIQTYYTQLMLEKGILAGKDFYAMYAHTVEDCEQFAAAVRDTFDTIANSGVQLRGPVAGTGIKR